MPVNTTSSTSKPLMFISGFIFLPEKKVRLLGHFIVETSHPRWDGFSALFLVIDYWFKYLGLTDQPVTQTLAQFYTEYTNDPTARERYYEKQIEHRGQTRSSFFRVIVGPDEVTVEIYRDDARGGPYELRTEFVLD